MLLARISYCQGLHVDGIRSVAAVSTVSSSSTNISLVVDPPIYSEYVADVLSVVDANESTILSSSSSSSSGINVIYSPQT